MQSIQRAFPSIFADDIHAVRDFYVGLFAWSVAFDSDWFIHLQAAARSASGTRRNDFMVPT
ncbi:MAG: hypothetical protein AAFQ82_20630, partial [Myxococcota bacterium]